MEKSSPITTPELVAQILDSRKKDKIAQDALLASTAKERLYDSLNAMHVILNEILTRSLNAHELFQPVERSGIDFRVYETVLYEIGVWSNFLKFIQENSDLIAERFVANTRWDHVQMIVENLGYICQKENAPRRVTENEAWLESAIEQHPWLGVTHDNNSLISKIKIAFIFRKNVI